MNAHIIEQQIYRLAKIYLSRPVSTENLEWHTRVGRLQAHAIRLKRSLKKQVKHSQTIL